MGGLGQNLIRGTGGYSGNFDHESGASQPVFHFLFLVKEKLESLPPLIFTTVIHQYEFFKKKDMKASEILSNLAPSYQLGDKLRVAVDRFIERLLA